MSYHISQEKPSPCLICINSQQNQVKKDGKFFPVGEKAIPLGQSRGF
jgi:hypothetical protein